MDEDNEVYVCRRWNHIERKKDKTLLVWSEIPSWLVVDDEMLFLLHDLNVGNTVDGVADAVASHFSQPLERIREQVLSVIPVLLNAKIVYRKSNGEPAPKYSDMRITDVLVHPTNRCNLRCVSCCNKNNRTSEEVGFSGVKKFLDGTLGYTVEKPSLWIVGGEPLLVPDMVLKTARYAKKIGFGTVGVSTNGTLVTRDFARRAKRIGLESQVSIDGATEEENDRVRGKGTFKRIIRGIEILKEEGAHVVTNFTCHTGNYQSLGRYFTLALSLGVDQARFGPLKRIGGGLDGMITTVPVDVLLEYAYHLFIRFPEYRCLLGRDYFSVFGNACRLNVKGYYCGTGMRTVLLNSDGNIYPCSGHAVPEFNAGSISEKPFSEIWLHSPVLKKIRKTYPVDWINKKCSVCMVRYWCLGGCRAEAYHCTHRMDSPAVDCELFKKAVINMIWMLSETPDLGMGKTYSFD